MGLSPVVLNQIGKAIVSTGKNSAACNAATVSIFEGAANNIVKILDKGAIDFQLIKKIIPTYFRRVGESNIAGPMLSMQSTENLTKLKESGIKTLIDFRSEASIEYQKICKQMGFKYFSFPLDLVSNFMNSHIFIKQSENTRAIVSDKFIESLKRFFNEVDKGNAYMGCRYGVHRTNTGLLLNYLLNPKEYPPPIMMKVDGEQIGTLTNQSLNAIKKIIRRLSPEQRKELNIPEDFLSNLYLKKVARLKEVNRLYYNR